jgi:pyrimidine-specific ribonucleoside hydrolase
MNRRTFLITGAEALGTLRALTMRTPVRMTDPTDRHRIPLIHITDLYHPPQDPDDHFDLATIAALEEYDLKGVILDVTEKFLNPSTQSGDVRRDPGFVPVMQMAYLLGRDIPVASGPRSPLRNALDDIADRPAQEQAGVHLLLDLLERSESRVVVSVVGSCRVLTAAFNRNRELVRSRVRSVLLNAGSSGGSKQEWNVGLDPEAYRGLWQSGLPIHWYPCATEQGAFNPDHERGTYWSASHATLLNGISLPLQAWFAYALTGSNRTDTIKVLSEKPPQETWNNVLAQKRNLWATTSLVMGAGRLLAKTKDGWRFMPDDNAMHRQAWAWRMDCVGTSVNENAQVLWHPLETGGNAFLFRRERKDGFSAAMGEALNALLRSIHPVTR